MQIHLDPEAEALVQRAMEAEGWPTPAVAVRELLAKYETGAADERIAGRSKPEVLRLLAEADASPEREYTSEELRDVLRGDASAGARQVG